MGKSNRRDPRVNIALDLTLANSGGVTTYTTKNISYRGIFVVTSDPLPLRRVARLSVPTDGEPIEMLGMVAHRINAVDAQQRNAVAGMGLTLFPCGPELRETWRAFIDDHVERDPDLVQSIAEHNLPRLRIHIKDSAMLESFAQNDVPAGQIFYRTPDLLPQGADVMLEIHHPSSGDRFLMKASVLEVSDGGRRHRGMQLRFAPLEGDKADEFSSFVGGN